MKRRFGYNSLFQPKKNNWFANLCNFQLYHQNQGPNIRIYHSSWFWRCLHSNHHRPIHILNVKCSMSYTYVNVICYFMLHTCIVVFIITPIIAFPIRFSTSSCCCGSGGCGGSCGGRGCCWNSCSFFAKSTSFRTIAIHVSNILFSAVSKTFPMTATGFLVYTSRGSRSCEFFT